MLTIGWITPPAKQRLAIAHGWTRAIVQGEDFRHQTRDFTQTGYG